jgi:hypothetical protein
MDLVEALTCWERISLHHKIVSEDTKEAYWIYFMKDGVKVGHVKTVSGGIFWNYPEELMKRVL